MGKIEDVNAQIQILSEQINSYQTEDIAEQELKDHDLHKDQINSLNGEIEQINSLIGYLQKVQIDDFITFQNPFNNFQAYSKISQNFENTIINIRNFAESQKDTLTKDSHDLLLKAQGEAIQALEQIQLNSQFIKVSQFYLNQRV
jgi:predicted  nucleic acid-binding Zn-ribbon protein